MERVSILARPSRAGRHTVRGEIRGALKFQSSPGPRGPGVGGQAAVNGFLALFQSSPGPRGPGVVLTNAVTLTCKWFQSSPGPRGPGVAGAGWRGRMADCVSILARPSRAGRLFL